MVSESIFGSDFEGVEACEVAAEGGKGNTVQEKQEPWHGSTPHGAILPLVILWSLKMSFGFLT